MTGYTFLGYTRANSNAPRTFGTVQVLEAHVLAVRRFVVVFFACVLVAPLGTNSQTAQATAQTTAQPALFLQQSLIALVGNTALSDITLTGSVRRIAGSDDESGAFTLRAISNGSARLDLVLSSGPSSEVSNLSASPVGSWSGPDGISHDLAFHNLLAESAWFSPALAIERRLSSSTFVATYVAHESLNGQAVEHISVSQTATFPDPPGVPTFSHLSQVDFYLDSTTLLPASIAFNIHPDNNELLDIPVQILFSDYRSTSSVQIPFHIQKFINNSLFLDLQIQSANVNTGLTDSNFAVVRSGESQ